MRTPITLNSIVCSSSWIEKGRVFIETCYLDQFDGLRMSYSKEFFQPFYTVSCSVSEFIMWYDRRITKTFIKNGTKEENSVCPSNSRR